MRKTHRMATSSCLELFGLVHRYLDTGFANPYLWKRRARKDVSYARLLWSTSSSRARRYGHMFVIACECFRSTSSCSRRPWYCPVKIHDAERYTETVVS